MEKNTAQFINELSITAAKERLLEVGDRTFVVETEGEVREIKKEIIRANTPLELNTLSGLIHYIKSNLERSTDKLFLHIKDEQKVILKGLLDEEGKRETLAVATAIVPQFRFDSFYETEELNIKLQAMFVKTEDRTLLLKVIGNLQESNVKQASDDGVSQAVTIKSGIASVSDVKVPNPVSLKPYRTFLEAEQPSCNFVFRMKDGPRAALFDADGGAWRNQAIVNVREYLKFELADEIEKGRIFVIA
ncbi:MAG: hypothetical protein RR936_12830 [Carnobacterium sp.]|uniref:hypothetical protein n=1 Tax=Carnobacterium sp. TaxID=48221 RepID=UPI002FC88226